MLSLFTNPIFRKALTALICCGMGFYAGYSWRTTQIKDLRKDKNIVTGKYQAVSNHNRRLQVTNDTLLSVIIELAKQERIKVDNHITDTKVKDGSQLNFIPKTRAKLSVVKTNTVDVVPTVTKLEPAPTEQPTAPTKEQQRDSWLRRLFTRKKR